MRAKVPARTRALVFLRCLLLQAAWNRRGMQNLGFAYAIAPALGALYAEPERRREALQRHLGFFNCHPYMAAAIVGGTIHHEERVAAGEEAPQVPLDFKTALQGPLAAIGDGFFWTALRPMFGALAALGALAFGWPAIVGALTLYNAIHLTLRIRLFRAGYEKGDAIVGEIARMSLPLTADRLRSLGAVLCGLAASLVAVQGAGRMGAASVWLGLGAAALGYVALARGARPLVTAYVATLAGIGAAVIAGLTPGGR